MRLLLILAGFSAAMLGKRKFGYLRDESPNVISHPMDYTAVANQFTEEHGHYGRITWVKTAEGDAGAWNVSYNKIRKRFSPNKHADLPTAKERVAAAHSSALNFLISKNKRMPMITTDEENYNTYAEEFTATHGKYKGLCWKAWSATTGAWSVKFRFTTRTKTPVNRPQRTLTCI